MSDLMLDVDQAGELKAAFRRGDWTNAEIKKACQGDFLARTRQALLGYAEIKQVSHVVDLDADPYVPHSWKVEEHKKGGQFAFDLSKIELYLSDRQKGGKVIEGNELRKELETQSVFNANFLDYLLKPENQHLIPKEWKGKAVFFWGTIYRGSDGRLYVRCLCWHDGQWRWYNIWLGNGWFSDGPALRVAS